MHLVVVGVVTRELVDVPVDYHGHFVANIVAALQAGLRSRFRHRADPRPVLSVKRPWTKCPSSGAARLAAGVDGAEGDVLEPCRYLTTCAALSCRSGVTIAAMCALARACVASISAY